MTTPDQRRLTSHIAEAFAILAGRIGRRSLAEKNLRLGFEAILRLLGTSPLRAVTLAPPPLSSAPLMSSEIRRIMHSLDACLLILARYGTALTPLQQRIETLLRAARRAACDELDSRRLSQAQVARSAAAAPVPLPVLMASAAPDLVPCAVADPVCAQPEVGLSTAVTA